MDLYHVLNRGVDKRTIFEDNQDYARFIHDMYEFNNTTHSRHTHRKHTQMVDVGRRPSDSYNKKKIVDIHGWCLMKNHYHLLLSECVEGGIPLFLKKLNGGYAKYFNERYVRFGALFQGRTKRILIDSDAYLLHILNYIHFNPLDHHENSHEWRTRMISDTQEALEYLKHYKWSSYQDYIGIHNFPSILSKTFFMEVFGAYKQSSEKYLQDISDHNTPYLSLE